MYKKEVKGWGGSSVGTLSDKKKERQKGRGEERERDGETERQTDYVAARFGQPRLSASGEPLTADSNTVQLVQSDHIARQENGEKLGSEARSS